MTEPNYPQWCNVFSGAAAGAAARITTAPFDLLKIRRQIQSTSTISRMKGEAKFSLLDAGVYTSMSNIARQEGGTKALFRGNVPALYLWVGYAAVQYSLYNNFCAILRKFGDGNSFSTTDQKQSAFLDITKIHSYLSMIGSNHSATAFVSGASAGVVSTLVTYPFDLCRTVFAAQGIGSLKTSNEMSRLLGPTKSPESIFEFCQTIYLKHGVRGFFAGCSPALIQVIPYMGLNFTVYDWLVRFQEEKNVGRAANSKSSGLAGFVSGGISKLIVYPLDTVKKRLQVQSFVLTSNTIEIENVIRHSGMINCAMNICKEEGFLAFYKGIGPQLLKSTIGTGVSFYIFTFTQSSLMSVANSSQVRL